MVVKSVARLSGRPCIVLCCAGSGSPTAVVRSAVAGGTRSSDSAASSWLTPSDLGMRSDTLVSPRMSPVVQHRRVPSLVVTSSVDKSGTYRPPAHRSLYLLLGCIEGVPVSKAGKRLWFMKQLRRAGVCRDDLLYYYQAVVRPVLEYSSQCWQTRTDETT